MKAKEPKRKSTVPDCPICASGRTTFLCHVDGYDLRRCPECCTDFVAPMPDAVLLGSLYDSDTWFEGGTKGGYQNYDQQTANVLPVFRELLSYYERTLPGREILDVGCGYGTHLAIAAAQGWKVFGIEVSKHAREIVRQRHGNSFYLTDRAEHLLPHQFDLILMLDVLEHLPDPYKLFFELFSHGAITDKTRIVITTPNARCRDAISDPAGWAYRHPPSHLFYYSGKSFQTMLARLHFAEINVSGIHALPDGPPASYADEIPSLNDSLGGYGGLLCEATGSNFMSFMHERYVPGTWSKITEYEHMPRYILAKGFAKDARVLDFGCGTGYGAALLADTARSVTAVDIDPAALEWARQAHRSSNLEFEQNSDLGKGLPPASFDLITCFELIEHIDEPMQNQLMDSFVRLLARGGRLLISTPNPRVTALYGENPYHLREMDENEFERLLRSHFSYVRMLNQLIRLDVTITEASGPHERADFHNSDANSAGVPANYVAICSLQPVHQVPTFCYFDTSSDYISDWLALEKLYNETQAGLFEARELSRTVQAEVETRNADIAKLQLAVEARDTGLANLEAAVEARTADLANLQAAVEASNTEIQAFRASKIYRLRDAVRQPFSPRKIARIAYLLGAMATPSSVRMRFRPAIMRLKTLASASVSKQTIAAPALTRKSQKPQGDMLRRRTPRSVASAREVRHVSVVIPTRNAGPLFNEVLRALAAQEFGGGVDLTIVDSGSCDKTVDLAEAHGAQVLRINPGTFDHGLTRNLAIEHVKGEAVILLTQDAVPGTPQMIANLVKAFADPGVAGVYGRQIPRANADVLTRRNLNQWLTGRLEPSVTSLADIENYDLLPAMEKYALVNFDNVCSAIRKSVWREFRFRQTDFAEDLEWSKRVLEAGWKIAYEPTASVIHSHRRSILYDYKRTYVCHRMLIKLFALRTVPSLRHGFKSVCRAIVNDWLYVWRNEGKFIRRIGMVAKAPFLDCATAYAQYRAGRDTEERRVRKMSGV